MAKPDPLVDSVKAVMKENDLRRGVEASLNKELGIQDKKQIVRERKGDYEEILKQRIDDALAGKQNLTEANMPMSRYAQSMQGQANRQRTRFANKVHRTSPTNARDPDDSNSIIKNDGLINKYRKLTGTYPLMPAQVPDLNIASRVRELKNALPSSSTPASAVARDRVKALRDSKPRSVPQDSNPTVTRPESPPAATPQVTPSTTAQAQPAPAPTPPVSGNSPAPSARPATAPSARPAPTNLGPTMTQRQAAPRPSPRPQPAPRKEKPMDYSMGERGVNSGYAADFYMREERRILAQKLKNFGR